MPRFDRTPQRTPSGYLPERSKEDIDAHSEMINKFSNGDSFSSTALNTLHSLKKGGLGSTNSKSYERILCALENLQAAMDDMTTGEDTAFSKQAFMAGYQEIMDACHAYILSHEKARTKKGRARLSHVRNILKSATAESFMAADAFGETGDFGKTGLTLRQLLAGMRPLQEVTPEAADFELPESDLKLEAGSPLDRLRGLGRRLRGDQALDPNMAATASILVEQILRSSAMGARDMTSDLLTRVIKLTDEAGDTGELLTTLQETCQELLNDGNYVEPGRADQYMGIGMQMDTREEYEAATAGLNYDFPDYPHLPPDVARAMAMKNPFNQGAAEEKLYGEYIDGSGPTPDRENAYVESTGADMINGYLTALERGAGYQSDPTHRNNSALNTIGLMDQATQSCTLPQNCRLYRMASQSFLSRVLGDTMDRANGVLSTDAANFVNQKAGTIITDSNFMCSAFQVDLAFSSRPIMMTLLCDKGTHVFGTGNMAEAEITFGRGTSMMLLGATLHDKNNGRPVPISHAQKNNQYGAESEFYGRHIGLEVFLKVLNK